MLKYYHDTTKGNMGMQKCTFRVQCSGHSQKHWLWWTFDSYTTWHKTDFLANVLFPSLATQTGPNYNVLQKTEQIQFSLFQFNSFQLTQSSPTQFSFLFVLSFTLTHLLCLPAPSNLGSILTFSPPSKSFSQYTAVALPNISTVHNHQKKGIPPF